MNDREYAKAGLWYILATFLSSALNIVTTPIFTRLLSIEEYGELNIYNTWYSILIIVVSLNAYSSIQIVKIQHDCDNYNYVATVTTLSSVSSLVLFTLVAVLNKITSFIRLNNDYLIIMLIEIVTRNIYNIWITHNKVYLNYKTFTKASISSIIFGTALSIILVSFGNMGVRGKIIGQITPFVLLSLPICFSIYRKSNRIFDKKFVGEILTYCLPLVLHGLSGFLLSGFDKVVIESLESKSSVAIYSLGYSYCSLLSFLVTAVNGAWVVWLFDCIKQKEVDKIRNVSKLMTTLFFMATISLITVAPEAITLFGSKKYSESVYVVPPILIGLYVNFIYTYYVNIEFYYKKTTKIALGTITSATLNIILNYVFIPLFGYNAAAYTTLVSYLALYIFHYFISKKIDKFDYYGNRSLVVSILIIVSLASIIVALYEFIVIRYFVLILLIGIIVSNFLKSEEYQTKEILRIFKIGKNRSTGNK